MIEQRNNFRTEDEIEIFGPGSTGFFTQTVGEMRNIEGEVIEVAPHAQMTVSFRTKYPVAPGYLLRRRRKTDEDG